MTAADKDERLIRRALRVAEERLTFPTERAITEPAALRAWARLYYATLDPAREHFTVAFLNSRHRLLTAETLFSGGLDSSEVHPAIVARRALSHPACAAVILLHNHPSGHPEPSAADHALTTRIKQGLALFDIRVLDHLIVAGGTTTSFAEKGWL